MVTFGLLIHGNYANTLLSDTNETIFHKGQLRIQTITKQHLLHEENLTMKTDFHVFHFQTNSISC